MPRSSTSSSRPDPRLVPGPPGSGITLRRLLRLMAVGCVVLPFASRPLASWSQRLPDDAAVLRDAIGWFDTTMERAGLTWPYDTLHAATLRLVAAPF